MDWTLERINVPQSFIVLGNDERLYSCGRSADSKIICPSLVVSRHHCIFLRTGDDICVIDLKSSNGVYVNDELIVSDTLIKLRENDVVGIGCNDLYRNNEPMFVYKLHKGNLGSRNLSNFEDLLTQKPESDSTAAAAAIEVVRKNDRKKSETELPPPRDYARLAPKRNLVRKDNEDFASPPPKITRLVEKNEQIADNNANILGVREFKKSSESSARKVEKFEKDEKEIEEIWSTLSSPGSGKGGEAVNVTSATIEASEKSLQEKRSERLTLDLKIIDEDDSKKKNDNSSKNVTKMKTKNNLIRVKKDLFKEDGKTKECSKQEKTGENNKASEKIEKKRESGGRKKDEGKETEDEKNGNKRLRKPAEIEEIAKKQMNGDNPHKTFRSPVESSSSSTRITLDIVDPNKSKDICGEWNENTDDRSRKKSTDDYSTKRTSIESDYSRKKKNKSRQKCTDDYSTKKTSIDNDNLRKNKDENKEKKRNSFFAKTPSATSSPFKLKLVKQEPTTSFSIVDTVDLSDDDEDIFPSSQLFDSMTTTRPITNGDTIKTEEEIEIKEENIFEDYRRDDEEPEEDKIVDCNDVIVLSDSDDDEDNPWLRRLSESQRIKEEELETGESLEMEFFDHMIDVKKDLTDMSIKDDEEEAVVRISNSIPASTSTLTLTLTSTPKINEEKKRESGKISTTKRLSDLEIEKEINNDDEYDEEVEKDSSDDSTEAVVANLRISTSPPAIGDHRSPSAVQKSQQQQQQSPLNKGPKIIEPLHLPQRKRRSIEDKIISGGDFGARGFNDCVIRVAKLPTNLTGKEKKLLQLEDKRKEREYEEEQRLRRIKNKWAQSIPLPVGKRKILPITKKQKLVIVNERKEKLKALALEKRNQDAAGPSNIERVAAKPKAKVSTKNRGDFLIDDTLQKKIAQTIAKGASKTAAAAAAAVPKTSKIESKKSNGPINCSPVEHDRRSSKKSSGIENKSKKNISDKVAAKPKTKEKDKDDEKIKGTKSSTIKITTASTTTSKTDSSLNDDTKTVESGIKKMSLTQKENRVPNLVTDKAMKEKRKKKGKKVTFRDDLTTVREFQIEPNNTLKKCVGKDALIPKDKLAPSRRIINREGNPKIEEFLLHILQWNPSWLEEQKHLKEEPPVVANDALLPLLTNYKNYQDYYRVMRPLFLLELWHIITKEFENIDSRYQTLFCSVVTNSVTTNKIPNSNAALTSMMLEMVASDDDIKRQKHPANGDLVFLELCYRNNEEKLNFLKLFAYVTYVHRSTITPHTFFNRELTNYVKNPSSVLTYTISTKLLKINFFENRVVRLRRVTCLRSNLRTIQALQSLPSSPLVDLTIDPKIEQYRLSEPLNLKQSSLITGDKLNGKQLEAVFKITETIVKKEPKICLVQGPPGTGKSHVIVNMAMQTLYGDNRYKSRERELRILLCAPSNAAIDEIVIRLLDRRAKLSSDRFKMVRVGISNSMHPRVRDISVEELAKRELKKTAEGFQSMMGKSMENIEGEKRNLEAKINSLQSQLITTQNKDDATSQYLRTRLSDMKARYELIQNYIQSPGKQITDQDLAKLQRGVESKILIHANIIACTLSSCYNNIMETSFSGNENISVCIVDEATQSSEAETLIPLMLGVNTLVLVGDPAQLPATIISQRAKKLGLDQSLFSRIDRAFEGIRNSPVIMLDVQYRMEPSISYWPNNYFYKGKLRNAYTSQYRNFPFRSYNIVNCIDSVQNPDKFSNTSEAEFVVNMIHGIINHLQNDKAFENLTIGVITPYRKQQILVQEKINERITAILNNLKWKLTIQVNTIDSFQGHERDIIIMSCVRTNGIGFMSDRQRLCVALTRAKSCFVLCGNYATFQRDPMWSAFLTDAQSRNKYMKLRVDAKSSEIISRLLVTARRKDA